MRRQMKSRYPLLIRLANCPSRVSPGRGVPEPRADSPGACRKRLRLLRGPADWLDRTVRVPTVSSLTLKEWLQEFERLKKLNAEIMQGVKKKGRSESVIENRGRRPIPGAR
jgi:hypothetical protein